MFFQTLISHPTYFIYYVSLVIVSITLHELAHGWAAISQGDDTPQITGHLTLNPVVHMGWQSIIFLCLAGIAWGQMPVNPYKFRSGKLGKILVSAAGPLSNLGLSILFIILIKLSSVNLSSALLSTNFLYIGAYLNCVLFLFNLLPIPPLDGFSIFSEIFPELQRLKNTQFGLFALMILFLSPFKVVIAVAANLFLKIMLGV